MQNPELDTHQKARSLNQDAGKYGTITEIGAGQETARWFFKVNTGTGFIAKAMSAYDMQVSDTIYGSCERYVSRSRLRSMLEYEYAQILERLGGRRGLETAFFAFANTVAGRDFTPRGQGHGWLGIRFQTQPQEEPSQIDMHVVLKGRDTLLDQETLGVLGVNLIYGAYHLHKDPDALLTSLREGLSGDLLEIDMIDFYGPAFSKVDNRLMALRLVQKGLSSAAMFRADGKVVRPADALYEKAVLVERSRFHPPTRLTMNLLDCAYRAFCSEADVNPDEVIVLSEMTLHNLTEGESIDVQDFLQRAEILCALGKNVLISDYGAFYRLAQYLYRYTGKPVGLALGVPTLIEIFNEKYYEDLEGGLLECFGRMFRNTMRMYACPALDPDTDELITADSLPLPQQLQNLYTHLLVNGYIKPLDGIDRADLSIFADDVLAKIRNGDHSWEKMVPEKVAKIIRNKRLFNCRG